MDDKQALRDEVWAAIRRAGVSRFPGVEGRIPNFVGAEAAAARLASLVPWQASGVVKANPDAPQWPVRTRAIAEGKLVYMAVPRLRDRRPFWRLDPDHLTVAPRAASSIKGAARHGVPVAIADVERIDLIVCGSVAVDRGGARLGKGGGFSDLEFALAVEAGLVGEWTTIVTTVHPVQLVDVGRIPMTDHDFPVDLVVLPDETIAIPPGASRPPGVLWDHLADEKIAAIPALGELRA